MKGCRFKILPVSTVKNAHPPHLRGGGGGEEGGRGGEGEEER